MESLLLNKKKVMNENEAEYRFGDSGPKYLMKGPRMSCGVVQLQPGESFPAHYHDIMEENFFVLEGELEIHVGEEVYFCKAGDLIHCAPPDMHYLRNPGTVPFKAVFMLAPYQIQDKVEVENYPPKE